MKKWLPIIMLASAVVVPGQIAEASTFNNTEVKAQVYYYNVFANSNLKGNQNFSQLLELVKDGKITDQEVNSVLQYTSKPVQNLFEEAMKQNGQTIKQSKHVKHDKPVKVKRNKEAKQNQPVQQEVPAQKAPTTPVQQPVTNETPTTPAKTPTSEAKPATGVSAFEQQVLTLTNKERQNAGLSPLSTDNALMNSARDKSADMANKGYFSHTSPTYGSPFDQMKANGISYRAAAENIAMGQRTPEEVVQGWMNSPGHRANIMNGNYTHIGIGYDANGHYWTQQFIQK